MAEESPLGATRRTRTVRKSPISKPKSKKKEKEEREQLIQKSISENVEKARTKESIKYILGKDGKEVRILTFVPVPKHEFSGRKGGPLMWSYQGCGNLGYPTCKNCGFYLSTGKSNEGKQFPGMWFPFMSIQTRDKKSENDTGRGWIFKTIR